MRTVKHKLKPLSPTQEKEFLELAYAYQFEKNYWSDQLLQQGENSEVINLKNLHTYRQIRDSNNLTKNNYFSCYHLPVRYCTIALKEAYDFHIRTYEAQIALLKNQINNKIYQFKEFKATKDISNQAKLHDETETELGASPLAKLEQMELHDEVTLIFKEFLYFVTNSLFYNYQTFRTFEEEFYSKSFRKARIYKRIQPILQKLLKKAIEKEVFTLYVLCNDFTSSNEDNTDESLQLDLHYLQENVEMIKQFVTLKSSSSLPLEPLGSLDRLLHYYCNCLVKAIIQFRNYKPIQSQINPTITLDGSCYKLYSIYDKEAQKNRWFLDIMSMQVGKRIKGLELTGFHHAKKIMKHKKYANLVLSFDRNQIIDGDGFYAHFVFERVVSANSKTSKVNTVSKARHKTKKHKHNDTSSSATTTTVNKPQLKTLPLAATTIGGDFGLTESFTFSDGWVSGRKQGQILSYIANSTKNSVTGLQRISEKGFFGVEKNNKIGKRNHKNNCFNHNELLGNINKNYRKKQQKHNRFLQNYKYVLANEIIEHFTSDSVYGQYNNATHEQPIQLVFESLDYTSLGRNKDQKRQINLIKEILNVLEEKINANNLPIQIIYVNPAYTSQTCPNCCFVAKKNRDSKVGKFRCQHCGFSAIDDERYQGLTKVISAGGLTSLPSEDDFVAACNIAARPSTIPDSMKLRVRDIKYRLMQTHESIKVSCKMFNLR